MKTIKKNIGVITISVLVIIFVIYWFNKESKEDIKPPTDPKENKPFVKWYMPGYRAPKPNRPTTYVNQSAGSNI